MGIQHKRSTKSKYAAGLLQRHIHQLKIWEILHAFEGQHQVEIDQINDSNCALDFIACIILRTPSDMKR